MNLKYSAKLGGISTKRFLDSERSVTKLLKNKEDALHKRPIPFLAKQKYSGGLMSYKELLKAIFRDYIYYLQA